MILAAAAPEVYPNPVFEGSEKRVEVDFRLTAASPANGLRALSREQLDELMTLAACTIVSARKGAVFDAYVLSESSLFVYPTKFVLKTCGTTKLLDCVPRLLEMAANAAMEPRRCKFSRASLLFPDKQVFPHQNFDDETFVLRGLFGHMGNGGSAYVLGDKYRGLQWHIFVADADGPAYTGRRPTCNLEVCMTELDPVAAKQFFRDEKFVSSDKVTEETGIRALCPAADIDDYVFEPCGYSMNAVDGKGFVTIHITPEAGFSYASVEFSGFSEGSLDPNALVEKVLKIFNPAKATVSLTVDVASTGAYGWGSLYQKPAGYGCSGATCQELSCGGRVSFYSLAAVEERVSSEGSPASPPQAVLMHIPSFCSSGLWNSDDEVNTGGVQGGSDSDEQDGCRRAAKKLRTCLGNTMAAAKAGNSCNGAEDAGCHAL